MKSEAIFGVKIIQKSKVETVLKPTIKYLLLAIISLFFLFPFIIMICYSFLPDSEALDQVLISKTGTLNLGTYITIFKSQRYLGYLGNSLIVGVLSAIGVPVASSLCAYAFSKLEFKGRNVLFAIVLSTMMLPSIVVQIPLYTVYTKLGWSDTLIPLWLPGWLGGGATNIFLMTQFMKGIPNDISAAAKIDGANSLVIFARLIIPLCIPVFLYVMVLSFIGSWNDFMTPLLYITDPKKFTLSIGIYKDYGGQIGPSNLPNMSMAAGVVMMLPCMILFLVFQRYLIEGVSITGLKG